MGKVTGFFKESYMELRKVVWPARAEVANSTRVVIFSLVLIAIALGVVDGALTAVVNLIF